MTLKILEWTAFAAVLAILAVMGGCESPKPQRVETLIDNATADRPAFIDTVAAEAAHEREQAAQAAAIEAVQADGWKGWHPPFEPIDE